MGLVAGTALQDVRDRKPEIRVTSKLISKRTAFDIFETKSRINEIVIQATKPTVLAPEEFAGLTYFWCVYDLVGLEPGDKDIFDIQRSALESYRTMFSSE